MKNVLAIIFLVILSATLYTLTLRGVYGNPEIDTVKKEYEGTTNPLELSPERGRFAHVMALGEYGSYNLNQKLGELAFPDVGYNYKNGNFYSYFAPGISYMAAPFYLLGKQFELAQVFTFGFISLMSILAIIFIFKVAREILKLPLWASILSSVIFAFGSTAWSYSGTLYQHHLTTFFIISGFYAAWRYKQNTKFSWTWAIFVWINYALAITIDYPNVLLMLPVMAYLLFSAFSFSSTEDKFKINLRTSIVTTMLFFILITGAHLYHNNTHFGGWFKLSGELTGYKTLIENSIDPKDPNVGQLIKDLQKEKSALGFFSEFKLVRSFNTLFFSWDRGLLIFAPIFILGLFGLIHAFKRETNPELLTLVGVIAANVFLYSSWGDPWGGWAYGPRYLILSMSVLSMFVAYYLSMGEKLFIKKIAATPLFLYSSAIGLIGALTTNAIPSGIEAIDLGSESNFFFNLPLLKNDESSSFLYRTYFYYDLTLMEYFWAIFSVVAIVFLFLVFIMPIFKRAN